MLNVTQHCVPPTMPWGHHTSPLLPRKVETDGGAEEEEGAEHSRGHPCLLCGDTVMRQLASNAAKHEYAAKARKGGKHDMSVLQQDFVIRAIKDVHPLLCTWTCSSFSAN